ncbi:unnamed protein product, partial [Thlaspi arvense]
KIYQIQFLFLLFPASLFNPLITTILFGLKLMQTGKILLDGVELKTCT